MTWGMLKLNTPECETCTIQRGYEGDWTPLFIDEERREGVGRAVEQRRKEKLRRGKWEGSEHIFRPRWVWKAVGSTS